MTKRCRWHRMEWSEEIGFSEPTCRHPVINHIHLSDGLCYPQCTGCPCHEPQPDPTTDTCRWWKDEYGNWCCACSDILPAFTPWRGTAPDGCFCPKCGGVITGGKTGHDKP